MKIKYPRRMRTKEEIIRYAAKIALEASGEIEKSKNKEWMRGMYFGLLGGLNWVLGKLSWGDEED